MEKKNTMLLTIIAVATLLVAVVGATFAYFTAQNGASGSTTATVTTETIGAITVSNEDPALYLDLTAAQMQEGVTGSYWATKTKGAEPATNYASADKAVIAKLNVSGGGEETVYSCNFKITVDKTDVTLAYGDAAVVFALENNAEILGVTSGSEIDYTTLLNEYTVNFTRVGDTEEDLPLVSVSMRVSNTEVEQGFAGETLTTTFTSSDLECEVVDNSDVKTLSGTWRFSVESFDTYIPGYTFDKGSQSEIEAIYNELGVTISPVKIEFEEEGSSGYWEIFGITPEVSYEYSGDWVEHTIISKADIYVDGQLIYDDYYFTSDSDYFLQMLPLVTFEPEQIVDEKVYEWFLANAKPVIEVYELPTEHIDTNAIYKTYEYTAIDSTDTTTIKAGTYRFNDVLTILNSNATEATDIPMNFTCTYNEIDETTYELSQKTYQFNSFVVDIYNSVGYWYNYERGLYCYNQDRGWETQYMGFTRDEALTVYPESVVDLASVVYGKGIQTITINNDTEVSDVFGTWFIANAKEQGAEKYYQYIDGSWVEQ